jgi:predicted  nucleic acid-binding Zn-ribbon protein
MKSRSLAELAEVEGHVIAGAEHIARQREIIRRLERAGRGNSETAKMARDLLHSMELAQRAHIAHRDQLRSLVESHESVRGQNSPQLRQGRVFTGSRQSPEAG